MVSIDVQKALIIAFVVSLTMELIYWFRELFLSWFESIALKQLGIFLWFPFIILFFSLLGIFVFHRPYLLSLHDKKVISWSEGLFTLILILDIVFIIAAMVYIIFV